jgi:predicted hydrocarbon binding protein
MKELLNRIDFNFDASRFKRLLFGKELVVHCHHYNARIQGTLESSSKIDGKGIIRSSSQRVFYDFFVDLFQKHDSVDAKWILTQDLYRYLGYGLLDCSKVAEGKFSCSVSHFVEGWITGFEGHAGCVCTFTEGYLQAAHYAITGRAAAIREDSCMVHGNEHCSFEVRGQGEPPSVPSREVFMHKHKHAVADDFLQSKNIDEERIISAMKNLPMVGNANGLIPLFNVYLANIPADFYNLVSIQFVEEMQKLHLEDAAKKLLICCGEICALHTFRGIMNSAEWEGLVKPMVKEPKDNLFALVTLSNCLGWGNWYVRRLEENVLLEMESFNGYEALGYRKFRGIDQDAHCFMFTGVSAGLMELIYSLGSLDDKFGTFTSHEHECISSGCDSCRFQVNRLMN